MLQILKDIYTDTDISSCLGFKGGSALMFFYELPRFSVDLDFNLLEPLKESMVYEKICSITQKYGKIVDSQDKFYGPLAVLNYGSGQRNLKVEISNRIYDNHYESKNLVGLNITVLTAPDMFAHKLCALLDRSEVTNRDIFDVWFFMNSRTPLNSGIIEYRMKMPLSDYLGKCIEVIGKMDSKKILDGLGDLMDEDMKAFTKKKLLPETITLLQSYRAFPILI
jgi:Uncharacterized conserved protein